LDATLAVEPKQPIRAAQTVALVGDGNSEINDRQRLLYPNPPGTGRIAPNQKVPLDL
jgi:hypothetical protein